MKMTGQQTRDKSNPTPAGRLRPTETKPGAGKEQAKMPPGRTWLWLVLILLANYLLVSLLMPSPDAPVTVPYTLFKEEVANRNVEAIHSQGETITGRFKAPVTYPPAGEKMPCPAASPKPRTSAVRPSPRRLPNGEQLHDYAALFRRPGVGSIFDRKRGRDQRQTYRRRRQPLVDAAVRVWPGPALHRILRLDVPARGATGRWHGRAHGHRPEQGAPLRSGKGYEGHLRRCRRHRRSRE